LVVSEVVYPALLIAVVVGGWALYVATGALAATLVLAAVVMAASAAFVVWRKRKIASIDHAFSTFQQ
jgi:LPXTG-motif cell wall-anchored protein